MLVKMRLIVCVELIFTCLRLLVSTWLVSNDRAKEALNLVNKAKYERARAVKRKAKRC